MGGAAAEAQLRSGWACPDSAGPMFRLERNITTITSSSHPFQDGYVSWCFTGPARRARRGAKRDDLGRWTANRCAGRPLEHRLGAGGPGAPTSQPLGRIQRRPQPPAAPTSGGPSQLRPSGGPSQRWPQPAAARRAAPGPRSVAFPASGGMGRTSIGPVDWSKHDRCAGRWTGRMTTWILPRARKRPRAGGAGNLGTGAGNR